MIERLARLVVCVYVNTKETAVKGEGNAPRDYEKEYNDHRNACYEVARQARAERRAECKARRNGQSVKEAGKAVTKDSRRIPNPTLVGNAPRIRCTKAPIPYVEALAQERDQLRAKFNSVTAQRDDEMKANRKYRTRITELLAQRDELLAALKDIETRAGYALIRPDKTNNDIQLDYIKQKAQSAITKAEQH